MRDFTFDQEFASALLENLASPVRLEIVRMLREGEMAVTKIAVSLNMSQSAISQHLRKLRDGGVVHTRRDAQMIFYSLPEGSSIPTFLAVLDEATKSAADMSAPLHHRALPASDDQFRNADDLVGLHSIPDHGKCLVADRIIRHQIMRLFQIDPLNAIGRCELVDVDCLHRVERHGIEIVLG